MYIQPQSQNYVQNPTIIIVPRLSKVPAQIKAIAKGYGYQQKRINPNIFTSPKINTKFYQPDKGQFNKKYKATIYQFKQNLSPIILEQKKLESRERMFNTHLKRPVSSYQPAYFSTSAELIAPIETHKPNKISPFNFGRINMDSVCSKMSESIILSSDTLDSLTQVSAPLSVDQFEKIKFLGQGKFGQVHLAKHKQTGFICALKIIDKNIVREQKTQGQIAKQLRIHSKLKSLNIIDFYGFFDDQKYFYILLEYATQGSVFSKLKGKTRLQQYEIQPIARGLCDGLRFMHRMGYIHRDIKPQNIVLQFGITKICDFGWATDCDDMHLCKSYCGTPLYLSPEMVKKQFYGNSVDIWAAGLVVYQLLVGRVPFSIWSQNDMSQIIFKQIQFPQYIDRSQKCQSFIRKCLQKQTFNRMQLNQALKHPFLNQLPTFEGLSYQFFQKANQLFNNKY